MRTGGEGNEGRYGGACRIEKKGGGGKDTAGESNRCGREVERNGRGGLSGEDL